jgi:hypothetical protein
MVMADDAGSSLGTNEVLLRFPVVTVRTADNAFFGPIPGPDYNGVAGTGLGADLSVAWAGGPWKVGMLAENVFNSFKWDTERLAFLPGTGSFNADSNSTDFDQRPYSVAPQALRDLVEAQSFKPAVTIGAALQIIPSLTVTADIKQSMADDDAIVIGPKNRFGVGAEWRLLPFIPLRAGVASVSDGWQAGAGVGVHILGFELSVSSGVRQRGSARESGMMIGLVGLGR